MMTEEQKRRCNMKIADDRLSIKNNYALYIGGRFRGEYVSIEAVDLVAGMRRFGESVRIAPLNIEPTTLDAIEERSPF